MSDPANTTIYRNVLWALLVLTVLTVGVANVHLGTVGNIAVGVLVAVIKGSLVVMLFMHLKYEQRWWLGMVLFPIVLVLIMIFANFPDTGYGHFTTPGVAEIPHPERAGH